MKPKHTIVGALLALTAAGAAAQGQTQKPEGEALPAAVTVSPQAPEARTSMGAVIIKYKAGMLDKDRDGKVSRAEAAGIPDLVRAFDKLDRDRDGKLSDVELDAYVK